MMKPNNRILTSAVFLGLILSSANVTFAQTEVKETTTTVTSADTISEFGPETIILHSETSPQPLRYIYNKATNDVDEDGAPVLVETVKSGLPVTVYYVKDGDKMMATKVVVRKLPAKVFVPVIEKNKTTTTTTVTK